MWFHCHHCSISTNFRCWAHKHRPGWQLCKLTHFFWCTDISLSWGYGWNRWGCLLSNSTLCLAKDALVLLLLWGWLKHLISRTTSYCTHVGQRERSLFSFKVDCSLPFRTQQGAMTWTVVMTTLPPISRPMWIMRMAQSKTNLLLCGKNNYLPLPKYFY